MLCLVTVITGAMSLLKIEYGKIDPRWHLPSRYYSHKELLYDGAEVEFFFIDTTPGAKNKKRHGLFEAEQLEWLDRTLQSGEAQWRIVVGHHPVFSGGHHGNTQALVRRLKPLLERHKVQAYINDHDHDMQHILVDGVHYLTSGAGSKTRPTGKVEGSLFAAPRLGFLSARLSVDRLEIDFVSEKRTVMHSATIPAG